MAKVKTTVNSTEQKPNQEKYAQKKTDKKILLQKSPSVKEGLERLLLLKL